jgi:hypothetical protein
MISNLATYIDVPAAVVCGRASGGNRGALYVEPDAHRIGRLAAAILGSMQARAARGTGRRGALPIGRIVATARAHGATIDEVRSRSQVPRICAARAAVALLLVDRRWRIAEIARWLGKNHTSVAAMVRRAEARVRVSGRTNDEHRRRALTPPETRFIAVTGEVQLAENCGSCNGSGVYRIGPGQSVECISCDGRGWRRRA